MTDYKRRSGQKEILDQQNIASEDIALNLRELDWINSHLGGHSVTIEGFKKLSGDQKTVSVCEIGCGGGDNLKALHDYCQANRIKATFTGIDINKDCITFAKGMAGIKEVTFLVSDYRDINLENAKPDIIFSSLFCHHFSDDDLAEMINWMKRNSKTGFFINDLHRHPLAYHFIKLATGFFSKSYLVKNDAPLSVLRGFTKKEWIKILDTAAVTHFSIKWKWAFRHLVIVFNS